MSTPELFLSLTNFHDISDLFKVEERKLKYLLYILPKDKQYTTFKIKKRSGGERTISSPCPALKTIQKSLSQILEKIYRPKYCVNGYVNGRNIITNAQIHVKSKYLLNIDLADFFGSINFGRVRGLFLSDPFNFNEQVSTILAQITCYNGVLPQGAPTSPILSNMICARLDRNLQNLAKDYSFYYTRYADDISFSRSIEFHADIVQETENGKIQLGDKVIDIIINNGFTINPIKVKLLNKYNRLEVTGLVVNKKVNVKRCCVRQLRAMIHAWDKFGIDNAKEEHYNTYDRRTRNPHSELPKFEWIVKGKLEFIGQVKGKDNKTYLNLRNRVKKLAPELFKIPVGRFEELNKKFLDLEKISLGKKPSKAAVSKRGLDFELFFNDLFSFFGIPTTERFTRNDGGEQIDGAFKFDNWHYIVECKWQKKVSDIRELDSLAGKLDRSGKQTMGWFISISGFSKNVIPLLKQNTSKSIILMNGNEIKTVLTGRLSLPDLISKKVDRLNLSAEPFFNCE
jgi:RNA-directed DNA polymerase